MSTTRRLQRWTLRLNCPTPAGLTGDDVLAETVSILGEDPGVEVVDARADTLPGEVLAVRVRVRCPDAATAESARGRVDSRLSVPADPARVSRGF